MAAVSAPAITPVSDETDSSLLGPLFGFDADEGALLGELVRDGASAAGLDGERLAAALGEGRSFGAALGLPPGLADVLYARAHRWFEAGRPERAEPLFRALCTIDGTVGDYWVGLGICLRIDDRLALAELCFVTAIRLRPDWPLPVFHLAELLARCGRVGEAREALAIFERLRVASDAIVPTVEADRLATILAAHGAGGRANGG